MKKLIFAVMAMAPMFCFAQKEKTVEQKKGPQVTFEKTEHNFGVFDVENAVQSCFFVFKNTGDEPLQIQNAVASCGCTVPEYPKREIAPGAKDSIKVTYDGSTKRPGVFKKVVTLTYNSKDYEIARVYITGEMVDRAATERVLSTIESK